MPRYATKAHRSVHEFGKDGDDLREYRHEDRSHDNGDEKRNDAFENRLQGNAPHRALCDARMLAGVVSHLVQGFGEGKTPRDLLTSISPEALVHPPDLACGEPVLAPYLKPLMTALENGGEVRIVSRDRKKGTYAATVRPLYLLMEGDVTLMEAWSEKMGEVRTYPIEHIIQVKQDSPNPITVVLDAGVPTANDRARARFQSMADTWTRLTEAGIPVYTSPSLAAGAIFRLIRYYQRMKTVAHPTDCTS